MWRLLLLKLLTRDVQLYWNKLHHKHFLMTLHVHLKKSSGFLRVSEYLQKLLLILSYDGLCLRRFSGHFCQSSKYVPSEHHWTYGIMLIMLIILTASFYFLGNQMKKRSSHQRCSVNEGVLKRVKSTYHFPKIIIFQQLPLKHFLQHPYDISIRTAAFEIQAGKLFTSSRSSHQSCSLIKGSPNITKFTGKTCVRVSFSIMLRASDMQLY